MRRCRELLRSTIITTDDRAVARRSGTRHCQSPRILAMDDDPILQSLYLNMLQQMGYEIEVVADSKAAVRTFSEEQRRGRPFDIVMLDLCIPGGPGGMETLAALQQLNPQVVAILASGSGVDARAAGQAGFAGVLIKPFKMAELVHMLDQLVSAVRSEANHTSRVPWYVTER